MDSFPRSILRRAALAVGVVLGGALGVASAVALAAPAAAQDDPKMAAEQAQAQEALARMFDQARSYLGVEAAAGTLVTTPHLSVRPREAATGTRTAQAGLTTLANAGFPDYSVYVPPQCVSTTSACARGRALATSTGNRSRGHQRLALIPGLSPHTIRRGRAAEP